jgi:hypothetical protein
LKCYPVIQEHILSTFLNISTTSVLYFIYIFVKIKNIIFGCLKIATCSFPWKMYVTLYKILVLIYTA